METGHVAHIFRTTVWLSAIVVLGSVFFWDLAIFLGALVGGGLAVSNFWILRRIVEAGARADSRRQGVLSLLFLVKFAAMIAVVYVAVVHAPIDMIAFLVGISAAVAAALWESLRNARQGLPHVG
jgi:ATP synthase I chain